MPVYEYECQDCGVQFEKMKSMSKASEPEVCISCRSSDTKKLVSASNFTFSHTPVGGPRPQNTGVHAIDYNADRVIGRDAEARWKTISARQDHKKQVIKDNPGSTGFDLSRTHEGNYRVMKPEERKAVESAKTVHRKAMAVVNSKQ